MLGAVSPIASEMGEVAVVEAMSFWRHYRVFLGNAQALAIIGRTLELLSDTAAAAACLFFQSALHGLKETLNNNKK